MYFPLGGSQRTFLGSVESEKGLASVEKSEALSWQWVFMEDRGMAEEPVLRGAREGTTMAEEMRDMVVVMVRETERERELFESLR